LDKNRIKNEWSIIMDDRLYSELQVHLFPGDGDEHGGIVIAGVAETAHNIRLLARQFIPARDGTDFVPGKRGYRALTGRFVAEAVEQCADDNLAYLAVHNHNGTNSVQFSSADIASHERGYPALLDITNGGPVGALVFAQNAIAGDIWTIGGQRHELHHATIVGLHPRRLYPKLPIITQPNEIMYDRQIRLFGDAGQKLLRSLKVGVIGAGGGGSLLLQMLARLGVGHIVAVDPDRMEITNYPRVVGARRRDAAWGMAVSSNQLIRYIGRLLSRPKVQVARRVACEANATGRFDALFGNIVDAQIAQQLTDADFLFLATDTMQSRLVFNALVHQYLIPGIQVGAKVQADPETGLISDVFVVTRLVLPTSGCLLCNGAISSTLLQQEALSEDELQRQRYIAGEDIPEPSVITLNALSASQAVNDFLFIMTGLLNNVQPEYILLSPRDRTLEKIRLRQDPGCPMCTLSSGSLYARGDRGCLPCRQNKGF
jgi:tRNA A37 threonylcarbamoyladenosine dehydratase